MTYRIHRRTWARLRFPGQISITSSRSRRRSGDSTDPTSVSAP